LLVRWTRDRLLRTADRSDTEGFQEPLEAPTGHPQLAVPLACSDSFNGRIAVDPLDQLGVAGQNLGAVLGAAVDRAGRGTRSAAVTDEPAEVVSELGRPLFGKAQQAVVVPLLPVIVGRRRRREARESALTAGAGISSTLTSSSGRQVLGLDVATVEGEESGGPGCSAAPCRCRSAGARCR